jgi:peptidoglycan/xylan/chitin deacetylase (PgdA/CDA1 family)
MSLFKEIAKRSVGAACGYPVLRHYVQQAALRSINVVYYHYVGAPDPHYSAFYRGCTVAKFAADLRWLGRVFDFAPLCEILASARDQRGLTRPTLAVTFDDGFNFWNHPVMEILDRFDVKATVFVITSVVGNTRMMWRHMLSAIGFLSTEAIWRREYNEMAASVGLKPIGREQTLLKAASLWEMHRKDEWAHHLWKRCNLPPIDMYLEERRPYFDWRGLREWIAAGHSVGFHTHTHPYCSRLRRLELEEELVLPALDLKKRLGITDLFLAYPFGDRLQPALEEEMFSRGVFKGLIGTGGFTPNGMFHDKLERAGLEGLNVGWEIYSRLFPGTGPNAEDRNGHGYR